MPQNQYPQGAETATSPVIAPLIPNVYPQGAETAPIVSTGPATPMGALEANGYKGEIANITTYTPQNTSQGIGGYDINANTNALTEVGPIQVATSGTSDKTYEPDQHAVLESTEAPVVGIGPGTVNTTIQEPIVSSQVTGAHAHNNQDKTWVVEVPSSPQTASENIKISLIENPVEAESQGMKEIDLTNNTEQETIKISFKGHRKKHHQAHNGQHEVLDEESDHKLHGTTNGQEEIKISFVKKKNATAFPITQGNAGIKDIKISFVTKGNRTIAQELPPSEESEPNNENEVTGSPFADQMFNNSTKGRNISVSFVGNKVLQEIPPAQKPIFLPEKGKKSVVSQYLGTYQFVPGGRRLENICRIS